MRIIHDLYQKCCEKRFSAYTVQKQTAPPRTTLYKYLVIPKEGQPPPRPPQMQQPTTPNYETRPTSNPFAQFPSSHPTTDDHQPQPLPRRSVYTEHEPRPRSDTLPFLEHTEQLQPLSGMRSGNGSTTTRRVHHPRHDEEQQEHQQQQEEQ